MKLSVENTCAFTVEQVFASYVEQSVREQSCRESGALSYQVDISRSDDGGAQVQVSRVLAPDIPDAFKRFAGDTIEVEQVEDWAGPDGDGTRTADIKVTIKGQPATMVGTAVLAAAPSGSSEIVSGDVKVAIPFIGRIVEPEIVKVVESALRIEYRIAVEWLASNA